MQSRHISRRGQSQGKAPTDRRGEISAPSRRHKDHAAALKNVGPTGRHAGSIERGNPNEQRIATIGLLRRAPYLADGRETEASDAAEAWAGRLEALGARVVEAELPGPAADTWPVFLHEAARSHAKTFPSRADEYGQAIRAKLEAAQSVEPEAVLDGYRALLAWRQLVPAVDLYVSPCVAIDLPAEDADELEVRLPLSSFLRWVNLLGWSGLAIGNLQLVAPDDETVLAAGLAWERG